MRGRIFIGVLAIARVGLFAALLSSCNREQSRFPVEVTVVSDDGEPFAGLPVTLGGQRVVTDGAGRVRLRVIGKEGAQVPVEIMPPEGFKLPSEARSIILRRIVRMDNHSRRMLPIEHTVRLQPEKRRYAVLVKTSVGGLPVEVFGTERATTNTAGVAMFTYEGRPGDEVKLRIATDSKPELRPQNPQTTFVLGARSDAYIMKERFMLPTPPKKRKPKPIHIRRL